ncbi:MAG: ribosome maturation factor RimP [Cytophagaceae bacterium]|nr:ribosome maturation factor RimP [Gemmatimonadaceae bacterium]
MKATLEDLVHQELEALGFDLIELRRGGTLRRPVLDVRIDRRDGAKVTVDDCALVSRALEPRLEGSGLVGVAYILEVSSPGVERPLRHAADWRRFTGRRAKILAPAIGGRVEVDVVAVEGDAGAEIAVVRDLKGTEHRLPLADIREARLVFVWNT